LYALLITAYQVITEVNTFKRSRHLYRDDIPGRVSVINIVDAEPYLYCDYDAIYERLD